MTGTLIPSFSDQRLLHGYPGKDSPVEDFGTAS